MSSIRIRDWPCCTIEPSCTRMSPTMPPSSALHHLGLARRHHPTVAALDLVENRKMRPEQKRHQQRQERQQQHARGARGAQRGRGPDVIGKGKVRSTLVCFTLAAGGKFGATAFSGEAEAGLPCSSASTLSRGPSATRRPLSNSNSRSTMLSSDSRWVEMMMVIAVAANGF